MKVKMHRLFNEDYENYKNCFSCHFISIYFGYKAKNEYQKLFCPINNEHLAWLHYILINESEEEVQDIRVLMLLLFAEIQDSEGK